MRGEGLWSVAHLNFPQFFPAELTFMVTGDLDVPQIALLVGTPDATVTLSTLTATSSDNHFFSALSRSSRLLDNSRLTTSPSPSDNHGSPCSPIPILRSARSSQGSIRCATTTNSTVLCDNNPEERDESPSYLPPNPQAQDRRHIGTVLGTGSSAERKTERTAAEDSLRFKLLSRAAHPDALPTATRTGVVHVDASLDAGTSAGSRVTRFFRRTVCRFRRPPTESDTGSLTGSDTARNGGQKGDNLTGVRSKEAQLARPVKLDVKTQQYSDLGLVQKRNTMDNLEERLKATKKLHGDAVDLQTFYESGTVATMQNLRATGKAVPCCLQKQNIETFVFFQYSRGHFHRTLLYSMRWTLCWTRFSSFTRKWTNSGKRRFAMSLKLLKMVAQTQGILNAGITSTQVLDKLSSPGRYVFSRLLCIFQPINTFFRVGHQRVMCDPYVTTICPLLQFVHFPFHFGFHLN